MLPPSITTETKRCVREAQTDSCFLQPKHFCRSGNRIPSLVSLHRVDDGFHDQFASGIHHRDRSCLCELPAQHILHSPLQVSFLLEANAKNLHQTGRAFIMREVLLYFSDFATQELHLRCSFLASLFSIGRHVRRHAPRQEFTE